MPNKTSNYALNQWEPEDNFLRTDFNEDNAKIDSALKALDDKANTKASQTDLNSLTTTVGTKANQSDLNNLTAAVNTKANQSDLSGLANTVNTKANQTDLNNLSATVWAHGNDINSLNSRATNLEAAVSVKCEVVFGSYTGDNSEAERTISLGFTPKAVLVNMSKGLNPNLLDGCVSLLALQNAPAEQLRIVTGGFAVKDLFNYSSYYTPYHYIAFK